MTFESLGATAIEPILPPKKPSDIFRLDYNKIKKLEGWGELSINNLKKVIDHVKLISENFDQTEPPILIVNAGGWSTENFISIKDKSRKYDILKNSFSKIDLTDVKIMWINYCLLYTSPSPRDRG